MMGKGLTNPKDHKLCHKAEENCVDIIVDPTLFNL